VKIVVTGAGGFIGRQLARELAARGAEVAAIVHREPAVPLPAPWEIGELGRPLPERALADAEQVIHLAHDFRPGGSRLNVDGTRLWFEQADAAGVKAQLYVSSCSAHPDAASEYGRTKFALESYFRERGGGIVRPGLVVGDGGMFRQLAQVARGWPLLPVLGGNQLRVCVTALRDLVALLAEPRRLGQGETWNVFSREPLPLGAIVAGVRRHFAVRGLTLAVPVRLAKPALALAGRLHASLRRHHESFLALVESQGYGYRSSYPALGVADRPLARMLADAFPDGRD
jgi:NADH dehydrogenase